MIPLKNKSRSLLSPRHLLVLAVLAFSGMTARAELILFDNLSAGSPNGEISASNSQWTAQSFSTTSSGFILSEVALQLWNGSETSGNFEIQIWDALGTAGAPGSQVGGAIYTGLAENLGNTSSLLTVSGLSVLLAPDTAYYLVAAGTSLADIPGPFGSTPGWLNWNATDVFTSSAYDSVNSGANWNGPFSQNLYMKVTAASAAVPEPGTWAAAVLLVGGAAFARWRKRKLS
jgi:hypothetical protein